MLQTNFSPSILISDGICPELLTLSLNKPCTNTCFSFICPRIFPPSFCLRRNTRRRHWSTSVRFPSSQICFYATNFVLDNASLNNKYINKFLCYGMIPCRLVIRFASIFRIKWHGWCAPLKWRLQSARDTASRPRKQQYSWLPTWQPYNLPI